MTKLQERILQLLKEIDALCRENHIDYYLAAGTAIGAIRHGGFLPWDDDADIYMSAENFRKFYALKDRLREDRALVSIEEDYDSGYLINRYADISTTRLYRYLAASPQPAGLIVDILVLDPVPEEEECVKEHILHLTEMGNLLTRAALHTTRTPYEPKDRENWRLAKKIGREKTLDILWERMEKYGDTRGGMLVQRDPVVPHVWEERVFGRPRYVPFEDTELPVAEHSYEHLCEAFDEDWMYVPDLSQRETHWSGVILDISNNNPFDDYLETINEEKVIRCYERYQKYGNFLAPDLKEQNWERLKINAAKTRLHYKKHPPAEVPLDQWLAEQDKDALDEYFREYRNAQCSRRLIGGVAVRDWIRAKKPFYIDLGDDFLEAFLRTLLMEPRLGQAVRILRGRRSAGPLSSKMEALAEAMEGSKRAFSLLEEGKNEEALALAEPLRQRYPENLYLNQLSLLARFRKGDTAGAEEARKALTPRLQADEVIRYLEAARLREQGETERARKIEKEVAAHGRQGLVLKQLRDDYGKAPAGSPEAEIARLAALSLGEAAAEEEE